MKSTWRLIMDTLRVANRSLIPASKTNDFLGLFDDISGVRGRRFRRISGLPGCPGRNLRDMFSIASRGQLPFISAGGPSPQLRAQNKNTNINMKDYLSEAGFDVFPAVLGRRAPVHD